MFKTLAAAAAAALLATGAHAATYQFGFTSEPGSVFAVGLGTLTTSDTLNDSGGYDITGISGTVSTPGSYGFSAITGLDGSFGEPDNELFPTEPRFDGSGIAFTLASGYVFNLYARAGGYQLLSERIGDTDTSSFSASDVTVAVTPTSSAPEPGTWALMAAGVGLAGAALRRRRTASLAAA